MKTSSLALAAALVAVTACDHGPTALLDPVDTPDLATPAMVLIENDGGNTAYEYAWQVDSASAQATFTASPKCAQAGCPLAPAYRVVQQLTRAGADAFFASAAAPAFRALLPLYEYPVIIPDIGHDRITVVENGRRKTVKGDLPPLALQFVAAVKGAFTGMLPP